MISIATTPYALAMKFLGIREVPGSAHNPQILAMLQIDQEWPTDDEVPWCGGFANFVCELLDVPRTKDLRARSWLTIGREIGLKNAAPGFDVVILKRGGGDQPGPEVIDAPGHVGFFAGLEPGAIRLLGGNQGDSVNISSFSAERLLGVRRLLP